MARDRLDPHRHFAGTGMMAGPGYLEELEERRARHERATRGRPKRTFGEILSRKMSGEPDESPEAPEGPTRGARDPLLGLSPQQSPELAAGPRAARPAKVIIKP